MTLTAADFASFYSEVYGVRPFPWQADLVEQVLHERRWPDLVDVPTGLGKTAMLDIAVFVAAATVHDQGPERLGRRRMFFVVDRRIVVDEAHERALHLAAEMVAAPSGTVTHRVATALGEFAPTAGGGLSVPAPVPSAPTPHRALDVTRMRGGVTWDAAWLERPDLPAIVVGTVDQVGSRLLFRGYGVSDRRKPIDAALVGMDSLILVDEAHLASAMLATLRAAHLRDDGDICVPRATVVELTATPGRHSNHPYCFDVDAHRSSPVAWRRLTAPKALGLVASDAKQVVADMVAETAKCVTAGLRTVLVVCNTVDRARQVHGAIAKLVSTTTDPLDASVDLLIGRSRPADRDVLVRRIQDRFGLQRERADQRAAVLVATQTVEVGANLDTDALVSESAPWDSLVQRLGRLNRLGQAPEGARARIVHDGAASPVYGTPRDATWTELSTRVRGSTIDVSPLACRALSAEFGESTRSSRPGIPLLTSPTLDSWSRTAPVPVPDTPVEPYLHGLGRDQASVSIAWRDGLLADDPMDDDTERSDEEIDAELAMLPVLAAECVDVPIHAARQWLGGGAPVPVSDLDDDVDVSAAGRVVSDRFRALAWRDGRGASSGGGAWVWVDSTGIRPGDVLVVPAERGGLDGYGWSPGSTEPVLDVAEVVRFTAASGPGRRRERLRIDAGSARRLMLSAQDTVRLHHAVLAAARDGDSFAASPESVVAVLADAVRLALSSLALPPEGHRIPESAWTREALEHLAVWLPTAVLRAVPAPSGFDVDRWVLVSPRGGGVAVDRDDEAPECSSLGLAPVTLRAHHRNVGDRARQIAQSIGLTSELCDAVEVAARWHDLGKVEPRFQAMLCGGDAFGALLLEEPLAKSGLDPTDRAAFLRARSRSRLPVGARHEAWSAAFVRQRLAESTLSAGLDGDLVAHLVASHHGHARPWLPPVVDRDPVDVTALVESPPGGFAAPKITIHTADTVDSQAPVRFATLNRRYGRWGLGLLEAVVRCADMTVSGEGS